MAEYVVSYRLQRLIFEHILHHFQDSCPVCAMVLRLFSKRLFSLQDAASIQVDDSTPKLLLHWRWCFDLLFLNGGFLIAQTIVVNILRGVLPQRPEVSNSYVAFAKSGKHVSLPYTIFWIVRDVYMQLLILAVVASILLRWLASRAAFVYNRTKMITSGKEILVSFNIGIACSAIFFSSASVLGVAIIAAAVYFDYRSTNMFFLSFLTESKDSGATAWDATLFFMHFIFALGTVAEHLSRREVVDEDVLLNGGVARLVLLHFRWKRQVSFVATICWVLLYYFGKTRQVLLAIRVVSSTSVVILVVLHLTSFAVATSFLKSIIRETSSDLQLRFVNKTFLLKWVDQPRGNQASEFSRFAKQIVPLLLWHVSGRTFAAQVSMLIALCNWMSLVPSLQVALYVVIMVLNMASLLVFKLLYLMNPCCVNQSGDEIPPAHLGFGMLVLKVQLLRHAHRQHSLKMIPATIERLFEAITISYRWEPEDWIPVCLWNRDSPHHLHTIKLDVLNKAWQLPGFPSTKQNDFTLIWLDQAAIDQLSQNTKQLLVPKMTACYALSFATFVIDNSHANPRGTTENYFSRTWTFQEFCLPPFLIILNFSPLNNPPDSVTRKKIQQRFWAGSRRAGHSVAAEFQEFYLVWLDSQERIIELLLAHPEILDEYLTAADTRHGFYSGDRFAALMQTISGVMCFTQEAVDTLKRSVLLAMAQLPSRFHGRPIIDNTGWGIQMSGSAHSARLLAGKPCPGDQLKHAALDLYVNEEVAAYETAATVYTLNAHYNPYGDYIPVRAVVDPSQNILRQLYVEVFAAPDIVSLPSNSSSAAKSSVSEEKDADNHSARGSASHIGLRISGDDVQSIVTERTSNSSLMHLELD